MGPVARLLPWGTTPDRVSYFDARVPGEEGRIDPFGRERLT